MMTRKTLALISVLILPIFLDSTQAQPISPASPSAKEIWRLYNTVLILAVLIGVVFLGFLVIFTLKYRERRPPTPPTGPVVDKELVRGHLVVAMVYFVLGVTFAAIASLHQAIGGNIVLNPEQFDIFLTDINFTILWGWGLLGVLGLCYFFLPSLLSVRVFSRSAAAASFWLINLGVIGSLLSFSNTLFVTAAPLKTSPLYIASQLLVGLGFYIASFNVVATFVEGSRGKKYLDIPAMAVFLVISVAMFLEGSALYSGFMIVLLLKQSFMPKAAVDPLFAQNLISFIFKPMLLMFLFPAAGALCHYLPEKVGRPLRGRQGIYRVAIPLFVILAFLQWIPGTTTMPPWSKALGGLIGWAMLIPVTIVLAGSLSTFLASSSTNILDTKTRLLTGATVAWAYAAVLGALMVAPPSSSSLLAGAQVASAQLHLLLLGVYSMALLAIIADLWVKVSERELFGQTFGKVHFWFTSIGIFGISSVMLVAGLSGVRGREYLQAPAGHILAILIVVFALAIGIPQYGYSVQIFRSFLDVGIRRTWGALGLLLGLALANSAIYGLAANKFGLTLITGVATAIGGAIILFFSIAILLSEGPKPSTASTA